MDFCLILALTASGASGSGGGSSHNSNYNSSNFQLSTPLPDNIGDFFTQLGEDVESSIIDSFPDSIPIEEEWQAVMWVVIAFVATMLILSVIMTVLRYVSETAVIKMVDNYEATDTKMSIREGFRAGWSRSSWRLFLINLLVSLPGILLLAGFLILGIIIFSAYLSDTQVLNGPTILVLILTGALALFVVVVLSVFLDLLRHFFWREAALKDMGVIEAMKSGFAMFKKNWKSIGMMWLIMIGLGIVWAIVVTIALFILIPVMIITTILSTVVSALPTLLFYALFSTFLHGWLPWIMAGLFVMPLFATLAFSPIVLLSAWECVYKSIVWTLTYRELNALPEIDDEEMVIALPDEA